MRKVKIEFAQVGDILAQDLYDIKLRLLIKAGKELNESNIIKIKQMGVSEIYIEDVESKGINILNVIPDTLKLNLVQNLKDLDLDNIHDNAKTLVDYIVQADGHCNEFVNMKTFDNYTYEHSVAVAVYAVMLGLRVGLGEKELVNIAMTGLLHDIGKLLIDRDILYKPGRLTAEEFSQMKKHATYGYEQVKDYSSISATIKVGIYQHHENEDGTGYPNGLESDKIYKFAKIIHVVDVYDALISKRPYKDPKTSADALSFLLDNVGTMFNEEFVNAFFDIMPAYSVGTTVKLSTGEVGIVYKNSFGNAFTPVIRLKTGEEFDLSLEENVGIYVDSVIEEFRPASGIF